LKDLFVENGELNDWILMEDFLLIQATSADATRDTLMQALRRKKVPAGRSLVYKFLFLDHS